MSSADPYSSPNLTSTTPNTSAGLLEPLEASVGGTRIRSISNGVKPILNIGYGINMSVPERLMAALYAMTVLGTVVTTDDKEARSRGRGFAQHSARYATSDVGLSILAQVA
jgi:hypothetical protein